MTDFLLELYSEEIPAGMQARGVSDLARLIRELLAECGIDAAETSTYVAPQRMAVIIAGLPARTPDRHEQKKGPRVDAPEKAIQGFLRANDLASTDDLQVQDDPKGAYYLLNIDAPGQDTALVLAAGLPDIIRNFPWPKSMRWGAGALRWVRPLRGLTCCFGDDVIDFEVDGLRTGKTVRGHRFMAPETSAPVSAENYVETLMQAKVMVDASARAQAIEDAARQLAEEKDCMLVDDPALVNETAGLVEWPVPLPGRIDEAFMDVPDEVLTSVMRTHQKYFALKNSKTNKLAPYFITIANIETADQGAAIIAGNERVLRARLSDGRFFWDQDRKTSLEARLPALEKIVFHARLGTVAEKTARLEKLAAELSGLLGADAASAGMAARLCKADLVSGMVYEFPELQGIMGGYYADNDGLDASVGAAIRAHYAPLGPSDDIPPTPEACVVALADKIDTLAGFWMIDEKPTGSKDPYALRRAALGVIRIVLEREAHVPLLPVFEKALALHGQAEGDRRPCAQALLDFLVERLRVYLRERDVRHDVVSAVFARGSDDIVDIVGKAKYLADFLQTPDGSNLLAAYRRADGILKQQKMAANAVSADLFEQDAEGTLFAALSDLPDTLDASLQAYGQYLDELAALRISVDGFFDAVLVNAEDDRLKANRLAILAGLVASMDLVGDLAVIEKG
ncbi:MAG: glycine--tRNA ligase beta subunit [Hyphomicrobiales bacterium]|nr:MAG: glycine--tRNA ligase beta subunit [Hyphomicrobiales bacterium]